jgi:hypothetical protein
MVFTLVSAGKDTLNGNYFPNEQRTKGSDHRLRYQLLPDKPIFDSIEYDHVKIAFKQPGIIPRLSKEDKPNKQ